ncbi:MAG: hypothetical protein ACI9HY_000598 [Planctomycetaceae bacterium]|jgi:hypothetical protein
MASARVASPIASCQWLVGNLNRAPVITNPGPQEVLEDELLTFGITATDQDGDGDVINALGLPVGAIFDGSLFSWIPSVTQEGVYVVSFAATDDGSPNESSEIDVVITVGDNPTPPEQAEDLFEGVIDAEFPTNIENSYLANLKKVEQFIEQGKIQPAISQLNAFINKVEQDFNQGLIVSAARDFFVAAAQNLIDDLT